MPKRSSRKPSSRRGTSVLGQNSYGKSRVRMVKITRDRRTRQHSIVEVSADIALEGDFEAIHTGGDNSLCLPTDTMKNTVYALGKDHPMDTIEGFALHLATHFLSHNGQVSRSQVRLSQTPWKRQVSRSQVRLSQTPWKRARVGGREHPHCFVKGSAERQVCEVSLSRDGTSIAGGIDDLTLLKSSDSAFAGYIKDRFTTLAETRDRIFATSLTARWVYGDDQLEHADFECCRDDIRTSLIETFAEHKSESVQHTLFAMGEAALKACPVIDSIRLSMPNKHCLLVNLAPFKLSNRNEIFVPTDEPHGLIEATIERPGR